MLQGVNPLTKSVSAESSFEGELDELFSRVVGKSILNSRLFCIIFLLLRVFGSFRVVDDFAPD